MVPSLANSFRRGIQIPTGNCRDRPLNIAVGDCVNSLKNQGLHLLTKPHAGSGVYQPLKAQSHEEFKNLVVTAYSMWPTNAPPAFETHTLQGLVETLACCIGAMQAECTVLPLTTGLGFLPTAGHVHAL
jgi:hypothetical protein